MLQCSDHYLSYNNMPIDFESLTREAIEDEKKAAQLAADIAQAKQAEMLVSNQRLSWLQTREMKKGTMAIVIVALLTLFVIAGVATKQFVDRVEEIRDWIDYHWQTYFSSEADMTELCPGLTEIFLAEAFQNNPNIKLTIGEITNDPTSILSKRLKSGEIDYQQLIALLNVFSTGSMKTDYIKSNDDKGAGDQETVAYEFELPDPILGDPQLEAINYKFQTDLSECQDYSMMRSFYAGWAESLVNRDFKNALLFAAQFDEWSFYLLESDLEKFRLSLTQLTMAILEVEDPLTYEEILVEEERFNQNLSNQFCNPGERPFSTISNPDGFTVPAYCSALKLALTGQEISEGEIIGQQTLITALMGIDGGN